jgi:hypothetical protein
MTLKEKIAEFVDLAKQCPDKFQETCFQVLLEDYLSREKTDASEKKKRASPTDTQPEKLEETTKDQGDIKQSDIHVKVKRFMEKQGVSLEDLNLVFYKEGEAFSARGPSERRKSRANVLPFVFLMAGVIFGCLFLAVVDGLI